MRTGAYRLYTTGTGASIAGEELKRSEAGVQVRSAAYLQLDAASTKFVFTPLRYVEPEKPVWLNRNLILTDVEMSDMIRERYVLYQKQLDVDAAKRKLEEEASPDTESKPQ